MRDLRSHSEWTPWDSALSYQTSRQFFTIDEGPNGAPCPSGPRPFHPGFQAASAANTAAAHTAFSLDLTREDGEQNLAALNLTTPPGFTATLKGVSYCPESAIAAAALEPTRPRRAGRSQLPRLQPRSAK